MTTSVRNSVLNDFYRFGSGVLQRTGSSAGGRSGSLRPPPALTLP